MATLAQVIAANPSIKSLGQNYPAIASALNAPTTKANPAAGQKTPQPVPITIDGIWALVPSAERVKVRREPGFIDELRDAIANQNRAALMILLEDAVTAGAISATVGGTKDKLQALLAATTEVTAPATIPDASIAAKAGLGVVTETQVQAADVNGGRW